MSRTSLVRLAVGAVVGVAPLAAFAGAPVIRVIVKETDALDGVGLFTRIDNVAVANNGQWLIEADTDALAAEDIVVVTGFGFSPPLLAYREGQALTSPPGATLSSVDGFNINSSGHTGWNWFLDGPPSNRDSGVFFDSTLVIQEGDLMPPALIEPNTPYIGFFDARINDADQIFVIASVDAPSIASSVDRALVVVDNPGGVPVQSLIAREGDELIPGRFAADFGTGPHNYDFNNLGEAMYFADLDGDTATDGTIWLDDTLLAREGSASPVSGFNYVTVTGSMALGDGGDTVFISTINADASANTLMVRNGAKFMQEGDTLPAIGGVFMFTSFGTSAPVDIDEDGNVVWFGDWNDPDTTRDTGLFHNTDLLLQEGVSVVDGFPIFSIAGGQDAFNMSPNGRYIIAEVNLVVPDDTLNAAVLIDFGPSGCPGDMNCDGTRNFGDIDPFVLALQGEAAYAAQFPNCQWLNGDINGDNTVNFGDIDPFVGLLGAGACP